MSLPNEIQVNCGTFTQPPYEQVCVSRRDAPSVSATFSFRDKKWLLLDLLRPNEHNFEAAISFSHIGEWLLHDAKLYIAHLWATSCTTANHLQQIMVSLRDLCRLLPEYSGRPVDLTAQHAKTFVRRYCNRGLSAVSNGNTCRRLNNFFVFLRQLYP